MTQDCPDCGAAVVADQRYCIRCGTPLRPHTQTPAAEVEPGSGAGEPRAPRSPQPLTLSLRIRGRTGIVRLPSGRLSSVLAAGMLACGLLIGVAVGPVALGNSAAAVAGQIITLIGGSPSSPQSASTTSTSTTSSDSGGAVGAGSLLGGPSATPATPTAALSAAPASTAPSAATTTSSPTSTTSTTTALPTLNAAGTVIANDSASQSFDAVDGKHRLLEVHPAALGAALPAVGSRVRFAASALANGTTSAARTVTVKGARPATVIADGVVSFVNTARSSYVLSAPGVSLPIATAAMPAATVPPPGTAPTTTTTTAPAPTTATTTAPAPTTTTTTAPAPTTPPTAPPPRTKPASPASAPAPTTLAGILAGLTNGLLPTAPTPTAAARAAPPALLLPSVGQRLEVTFSLPLAGATGIAASTLREVFRVSKGQAPGPLDLAGVITTFDKTNRTAMISADGPGLGSDTIPLSAPASISLAKLRLPATVVAHVTAAAGVYTLTGLALDDSPTAAADRTKFLGDLGARPRASKARMRSQTPRARARARGNGV